MAKIEVKGGYAIYDIEYGEVVLELIEVTEKRKGHWHGYWQGTGQAKEFKIRWQPAIFVRGA
ncbi:hypothetical protein [Moraxella bovis]|uniref:Uncharacterized protein n=1 Tax=Moraxella bovis TaxID=476 RepID=A0A378Q3S9_MORBO|nr:hypothetical protein [Moraxella bovis]STY93797.1 Uncharacterised protein [Moraxella bovis]